MQKIKIQEKSRIFILENIEKQIDGTCMQKWQRGFICMGTIGFHTQNLELNMGVNCFKTKAFLGFFVIVGSNFRPFLWCRPLYGQVWIRHD